MPPPSGSPAAPEPPTPPPMPDALGLRFPRGARVRRGSEVRRVFDRGRSAAADDVVVYAFRRDDDRLPRCALVVGKRWGGAVVRNRVRRLLRESFRTARAELPRGFDFVLLPRGALHERKMKEVRRGLASAARRAARRYTTDGPRPPGQERERKRRR